VTAKSSPPITSLTAAPPCILFTRLYTLNTEHQSTFHPTIPHWVPRVRPPPILHTHASDPTNAITPNQFHQAKGFACVIARLSPVACATHDALPPLGKICVIATITPTNQIALRHHFRVIFGYAHAAVPGSWLMRLYACAGRGVLY
jgi:hypothetical protein